MEKYCIVNGENTIVTDKLKQLGYTCILTEKSVDVSEPISFHADILYLKTDINKIYVSQCQKNNTELFKNKEYNVKTIKLSPGYKTECKLNYIVTDKDIICNPATAYLENNDKNIVKVKQGYTKCSTIVLGEDNFITEDEGIYRTLTSKDKNCLLIKKGYVQLKGYEYGFIGGASAFLDEINTILFFGDITEHPDYNAIENFCNDINIDIAHIADMKLTDIGGVVIL